MISFVYLDVGGVALLDFSKTNKWEELKKELGVNKENASAFDDVWGRYKNEICISRTVDSLIPILNKELGLSIPKEYSLLDGFVKRFDPNPAIWPTIFKIRQKSRIGLLTNMYPGMMNSILEKKILPKIEWDIVIDSSQVGLQKPDPKIFELAQKKSNVPHSEILFVDNVKSSLETAQKLNWKTFLYDPAQPLTSTEQLDSYINSLS